jgi:hypothetical protein
MCGKCWYYQKSIWVFLRSVVSQFKPPINIFLQPSTISIALIKSLLRQWAGKVGVAGVIRQIMQCFWGWFRNFGSVDSIHPSINSFSRLHMIGWLLENRQKSIGFYRMSCVPYDGLLAKVWMPGRTHTSRIHLNILPRKSCNNGGKHGSI